MSLEQTAKQLAATAPEGAVLAVNGAFLTVSEPSDGGSDPPEWLGHVPAIWTRDSSGTRGLMVLGPVTSQKTEIAALIEGQWWDVHTFQAVWWRVLIPPPKGEGEVRWLKSYPSYYSCWGVSDALLRWREIPKTLSHWWTPPETIE